MKRIAPSRPTAVVVVGGRGVLCVSVAVSVSACATLNPVLAPARVLDPSHVSVDLGVGYAAPVADRVLTDARRAVENANSGAATDADRTAIVRAAAGYGATPAGLGPYAAARVGLGGASEASIAWVGRAFRIGARRVMWTDGVWALSLGAQTRFAYVPWQGDEFVPSLSIRDTRLVGGDVTVIVGRTSAHLYDLYFGARVGYSHGAASVSHASIDAGTALSIAGHRVETAVVAGLRFGFGRVSGVLEIDAALMPFFASTSSGADASGLAFALRPAAALAIGF